MQYIFNRDLSRLFFWKADLVVRIQDNTLQNLFPKIDDIHELRIKLSGDQIRILYFFCYQKYIVLYYAFVKTSGWVPDKFIRKVIAYRDEFVEQATSAQLEDIVGADI